MTHYLALVPFRVAGDQLVEVDCWLKDFDAVAASCACGWRMRLLAPEDLGVSGLFRFFGEPTDDALDRLTTELDSSEHAAEMVPAFQDLSLPSGLAPSATEERPVRLPG